MISLHVTLKSDATFGQAFRYGLQRSHRNHQFLVEMRAGLEGCRSFFDLRARGRRDGIGWASIRGGSSHGASLTEKEGLAWIHGVASELKLTAYAWFIHAGESERFDFHILCVNQFDGRKLRKREIDPLLHTAARNQTGILNAGRRATGRHVIGCCEADGTVVYPMAQSASTPPAPAANEEPKAPKNEAKDRKAPETHTSRPAAPTNPLDRPDPGSGRTQRLNEAESKSQAVAAAEAEEKRRKAHAEKLYELLLVWHQALLQNAAAFGKVLALRKTAAQVAEIEKGLKEWQERCRLFERELNRVRANIHLSEPRRKELGAALTELKEHVTAVMSLSEKSRTPDRDRTGPDRA